MKSVLKFCNGSKSQKRILRLPIVMLQKMVCVGLIEEKIGLSQSTVSQYLMLLQQAALITTERRGQWTYCKRNEKAIKELVKHLENI